MQAAVTMYYFSDEKRIYKTANAFGIAKNTVSMIIRRVTKAILNHLADKSMHGQRKKLMNSGLCFLKNMLSHGVLGL